MYKRRREQVMEKMGANSLGIWMASPPRTRSNDTEYRYRASSDLYYLTGCDLPESVLLLRPDADNGERSILFVQPRDPEKEIWTGHRVGPEGAKELFGVDATYTIDQLDEKVKDFLVGCEKIYYHFGDEEKQDLQVLKWLNEVKRFRRLGKRTPYEIIDSGHIVHEMRLIKDEAEIELMRKAAQISVEMHKAAMKATHPGMEEHQLDALLLHEAQRRGCKDTSYLSIVGGGANAAVLHYIENDQILKDGDLVLIDAGAEYKHYAGDITRTFPVNGKFTETQRKVYEVVLSAMEAAFEKCRPGNRFDDVHQAATRRLTEGLVELGVLEGKVDDLIAQEAYKPFFMHRTGHWLGIDVHDVGYYFEPDGSSRILRPGMVFTVEPGLYFNPNFYKDFPTAEPYRNIGIRIEDDILITEDGYENLTADAPKTVEAIEAFMAEKE